MKNKRKRASFLIACLLFLFSFLWIGFQSRTVKAVDENYFSVYAEDFTITQTISTAEVYCLDLTYKEGDDAILPQPSNYAKYLIEENILVETDKGIALPISVVKANGSAKYIQIQLALDALTEDFDSLGITQLTFPVFSAELKDSYKTKYGYDGLLFAEEMTFCLTKEGEWEVVTSSYWEVTKEIEGETLKEQVDTTQTLYTLPKPSLENGKLCVGWEMDGELYPIGEELALDDFPSGITIKAVIVHFSLENGASIRYHQTNQEASGMRFCAILCGDDVPTALQEVGIIVMPADLQGEKEFVWENYQALGEAKKYSAEKSLFNFDGTQSFALYATISNIIESNYNRNFLARGYVVVEYKNGESNYIWTENVVETSVYEVASKLLSEDWNITGWRKNVLENYANKVINVQYDGETVSVINPTEHPVTSNATISIHGNEVTILLTTQVQGFWAILYNGQRIKASTQTYSEGVLRVVFSLATEAE